MTRIDSNLAVPPIQPYARMRRPVAEYYRMYELGLIDVETFERSEIIDGELVRKMSIGDRHAWIVTFLTRFFILNLPESIQVHGQNPLRLGDYDEPEPDIVLSDLTKYDGKRHPTPAETILVIEVAESSLRTDRTTKLSLYATNEISESWIVNIPNRIVEVYTKPELGVYGSTEIFEPGSILTSGHLPEISLPVGDLFS
ncbi:MAG: Uma2 family endonuclease [Pyrinomonadaceae bacterium]